MTTIDVKAIRARATAAKTAEDRDALEYTREESKIIRAFIDGASGDVLALCDLVEELERERDAFAAQVAMLREYILRDVPCGRISNDRLRCMLGREHSGHHSTWGDGPTCNWLESEAVGWAEPLPVLSATEADLAKWLAERDAVLKQQMEKIYAERDARVSDEARKAALEEARAAVSPLAAELEQRALFINYNGQPAMGLALMSLAQALRALGDKP